MVKIDRRAEGFEIMPRGANPVAAGRPLATPGYVVAAGLPFDLGNSFPLPEFGQEANMAFRIRLVSEMGDAFSEVIGQNFGYRK